MKNLEAADLSTVYAFPVIGDNFEGSRSHVLIRFFYFFIKKTCQKNTKNKRSVYRPACWVPPLVGPWGDQISDLYTDYIFLTCVLGADNPDWWRDAVSSAELVGTHVKDQTGLGGPHSLKLLYFNFTLKAFQIIQKSELGMFLGKIGIALYSWETY